MREHLLPDEKTLEKVARYEAHLSRQLYKALHELEGRPLPLFTELPLRRRLGNPLDPGPLGIGPIGPGPALTST